MTVVSDVIWITVRQSVNVTDNSVSTLSRAGQPNTPLSHWNNSTYLSSSLSPSWCVLLLMSTQPHHIDRCFVILDVTILVIVCFFDGCMLLFFFSATALLLLFLFPATAFFCHFLTQVVWFFCFCFWYWLHFLFLYFHIVAPCLVCCVPWRCFCCSLQIPPLEIICCREDLWFFVIYFAGITRTSLFL